MRVLSVPARQVPVENGDRFFTRGRVKLSLSLFLRTYCMLQLYFVTMLVFPVAESFEIK